MDVSKTIASQFQAALSMMEETVRICPDELWNEQDQATPFWRVAYHALFYVNFYLQTTEHDHALWEGAREGYQFLGPAPFPPHEQPKAEQPYTPEEILDFLEFCRDAVDRIVPTIDLSSPSGFHWLPFDKMELQIYNIRHLQQHVGDLSTILMMRANLETHWVGTGSGWPAE